MFETKPTDQAGAPAVGLMSEITSCDTGIGATNVVGPITNAGVMMSHPTTIQAEKPEKFSGFGFKQWQQKMFFYLTTLNLVKYLSEERPVISDREQNITTAGTIQAWEHGDYLCKNYILNCMVNSLYGAYCHIETARHLWEILEKKYNIEHAGTKMLVVSRFLNFKMTDAESVIVQFDKLQNILHEISAEGMSLCDSFQVAAVIHKLPPSWTDFKNILQRKRRHIDLKELRVRFQTEDASRKSTHPPSKQKGNITETSKPENNRKRTKSHPR